MFGYLSIVLMFGHVMTLFMRTLITGGFTIQTVTGVEVTIGNCFPDV